MAKTLIVFENPLTDFNDQSIGGVNRPLMTDILHTIVTGAVHELDKELISSLVMENIMEVGAYRTRTLPHEHVLVQAEIFRKAIENEKRNFDSIEPKVKYGHIDVDFLDTGEIAVIFEEVKRDE